MAKIEESTSVCIERNDWAPEVVYHNGNYIMHFIARRKSDFSLRIGVAVSDSPEEPFVDAHNGPMFDLDYAAIARYGSAMPSFVMTRSSLHFQER